MRDIYQTTKHIVFTLSLAAGMCGLAGAQSAADHTQTSSAQTSMSGSSDIQQAQQELKQKGFYAGRVDGMNGPKTETAIRRYQRSQNLAQTGTLNEATRQALGLSNMNGNRGEASRSAEQSSPTTNPATATTSPTSPAPNTAGNLSPEMVRTAQQKLAKDGFYSGKADGDMNQGTRVAIREYQKANSLPVSGRLDRETAHKLGISTANGGFEQDNATPMEQLGKGIAEGAKTPVNTNQKHPRK